MREGVLSPVEGMNADTRQGGGQTGAVSGGAEHGAKLKKRQGQNTGPDGKAK
eukprot:CAMPEP_0172043170 /NCGR_PEP_ID=MMETSP1041-20130122/26110_1 /TAXON_ID=464988 /ORGANISM="Hemiselmis andersenii, Strain CCMP439" /LENGTH=51 /DNA_ID=CAMNT_0012701559 /DNA_START=21 /DNA_END=176 /DNA_ORIENTATION=-